MNLETKKINNYKKSNPLFLSLWFLVFSVVLTFWIYFYNISLMNHNSNLNKEIDTKQSSVAQLEEDSNVIISLLYNSNRSSIRRLENYSNITLFIDHISKISRIYWIEFKWFNYSGGKLWLLAVSSSEAGWNINYKKVSKFISSYRKNEDKQALFDLNLIRNIATKNEWVDNVFNINLDLKDNLDKIIEESEKMKLENKEKVRIETEERKKEFEKRKELLLKNKREEVITANPEKQ